MKKVIGYIISLTTIFLLVIFFTVPTVDAAIAANDSTSQNLQESSIPEVNVYSADKINKVKAIDRNIPLERQPPLTTFYNCPSKALVYKLNCDLNDLSYLVSAYERAVDRCVQNRAKLYLVNNAWNKLQNACW